MRKKKPKTITRKVRSWLELDSEAKGNLVMMQVLKLFSCNTPYSKMAANKLFFCLYFN